MSGECSTEELFAVLDDEYARTILTATSAEPKSAKELAEECDASLPTVYRRIDNLSDCSLLEERTRFTDNGRHYGVYRATLDQAVISLDEEGLSVAVERESSDPADRFTELWEDL